MIMLKKIEAAVSFSLKIGSHYLVFCLFFLFYSKANSQFPTKASLWRNPKILAAAVVMSPSDESTNGSRCSSCISSDNDGNDFGKSDEFTCKQCKNSDSKSKSKSVNDSDKLRRIIVASVKGFTIGTGLKGGLAIFSIVARFARRRRSSPQSR
jgi:hypothetical protein